MHIQFDGAALTEPIRFALTKLPENCSGTLVLKKEAQPKAGGYFRKILENTVMLCAGEDSGMMYGILDLADDLKAELPLTDRCVVPYLEHRGIKFNIPLDARVPSYTDAGTSAQQNIPHVWDFRFWQAYLDTMAENKFNLLTLWTLSPFPALVRIPEFPEACVEDVMVSTRPVTATTQGFGMYAPDMAGHLVTVKRMTMEEKMAFWNRVMDYAAGRCIQIYLFTWNVFIFGTEGNPYGITDSQYNPVTRKYYYCGVKALMDAYPRLSGIGITAGENMTYIGSSENNNDPNYRADDIDFTVSTYGRAVADYRKEHPEREFRIIHRMQMARYSDIREAFAGIGLDIDISFKYSQAHMYSSTAPQFIRSFLEEKAEQTRFYLTVRNDDLYMLRWGDPDFAREYLLNMPASSMLGFYLGADGLTWGRDYFDRDNQTHPLFLEKMWYQFGIWGQLSYDPTLGQSHFVRQLTRRFRLSREEGEQLYLCWQYASRIIPEVNCVHWHNFDFQWYPEGCCMRDEPNRKLCFADIWEFMECPSIPMGNYASVSDTARGDLRGRISAEETAGIILKCAEEAGRLLQSLNRTPRDGELAKTLLDIQAFIHLGNYYGRKLLAAVALCRFRLSPEEVYRSSAEALLEEAAGHWMRYSALIDRCYRPQVLSRLGSKVDLTDFDYLTRLDVLAAVGFRP